MLTPLQYWTVLLAVTAYTFLRGRRDERAAAIVCVAATLGTVLLHSQLSERFAHVEYGVMTVDLLAFLGFTAIAIRTDRFWPLWVAGLQLTTILSHILKAVELDLLPQAYAAAARLWVYPIFVVIVLGTWRTHQRRLREFEITPI
jgi:hypothetical protein